VLSTGCGSDGRSHEGSEKAAIQGLTPLHAGVAPSRHWVRGVRDGCR
jgi:hypothetical protein